MMHPFAHAFASGLLLRPAPYTVLRIVFIAVDTTQSLCSMNVVRLQATHLRLPDYRSDMRAVQRFGASGKNGQVKKVFRSMFIAMAGLVSAQGGRS
jgi:hypothetical protein